MSQCFRRTFDSLFEFLDTYRADIGDGYVGVAVEEGSPSSGMACSVTLHVPAFEEEVTIAGEVVDVLDDGVVVRLDDAGEGFERLAWMFDLCGRVIEQMLATGRFKVAGRPSAGRIGDAGRPAGELPAGEQPAAGDGGPETSAQTTAPETGAAAGAVLGAADADGVPPGMEPDASGELDQEVIIRLMMDAYRERFTGVLRIDHPLGTSTVFFDKGGPVRVADDPVVVEECLGVLLQRAGRIDEAQLKASLEMMNETGKLQGECLIEMGLLTFPVLVMALMKQTQMKMLRLYEQAEGRYARYPLERHRQTHITPPLKVPGILYKTLRARYEEMAGHELAEIQRPKMDLYSRITLDFPVDDLQLKRSETEFLEILSSRSYRLREIYTVSNMGRRLTAVNLMALLDLGILVLQADEDTAQVIEKLHDQLDDKLRTMEEQNHFERLELHWSARDDDVEKGYSRLREKWESIGGQVDLPEEHRRMQQQVLDALRESYEALRRAPERQEYRREVYEAQQIAFSADIFFRQGEMLMIKKRWPEVLDNFQRAAELRPDVRKYANAVKAARSNMER